MVPFKKQADIVALRQAGPAAAFGIDHKVPETAVGQHDADVTVLAVGNDADAVTGSGKLPHRFSDTGIEGAGNGLQVLVFPGEGFTHDVHPQLLRKPGKGVGGDLLAGMAHQGIDFLQ